MFRALTLWPLLLLLFAAADQLLSVFVFHHYDLTFERFAALLGVPVVQSLTLSRMSTLAPPPLSISTKRALLVWLVLAFAAVELAWLPLGFLPAVTTRFEALRALGALAAAVSALLTLRLLPALPLAWRRWHVLFVAALLLIAVAPWWDLRVVMASQWPQLPRFGTELLFFALPFVGLLALLSRAGSLWARSEAARVEGARAEGARVERSVSAPLEIALVTASSYAIVVLCVRFWREQLPAFWSQTATTLTVLTLSLLVVAAWLAPALAPGAVPGPLPRRAAGPWWRVPLVFVLVSVLARPMLSFVTTGALRWSPEVVALTLLVPLAQVVPLTAWWWWRSNRPG